MFEWIDAHIAKLRDARSHAQLQVSQRKLEDRTIDLLLDDETLHAVSVDIGCGEYEEHDEGIEEKSAGFSSNEIGECINFELTEAFFVWDGRLLAHWTQEYRVNCYCADVDDDEADADPCDHEQFSSNRPEPTAVSFSDDPELRELILEDGRGPHLECQIGED